MNLFDGIQNAMFDTITATFGIDAFWVPSQAPAAPVTQPDPEAANVSQGAPEAPQPIAGRVLFRSPAEVSTLLGIEYQPETFYIEFKRSVFAGLKALVDAKSPETITIEGVSYWVRNVYPRFDGQDLIAELIKD